MPEHSLSHSPCSSRLPGISLGVGLFAVLRLKLCIAGIQRGILVV